MLKRIRISVLEPKLLPNNLVHYATNFKISKTINFVGQDLLLDSTETVNLYDCNFTIDILEDDNIYIVTQYIYKVLDVNGIPLQDVDGNDIIKLGTPSRISSIKGNQEGVKISDTIVNTPTIIIGTSYQFNIDGNLMLKGSDFRMFSSAGVHKASTWVVKDLNGEILFKREYDTDNLTSIILPDKIKLENNFVAYLMYHSDTNADSNYGVKENIITNELPKYIIKPTNKFIVGKYLYFNVELLNKRFKNIDLVITDINGEKITINGLKSTVLRIDTRGYIEKAIYNFHFSITSENNIVVPIDVNLFSYSYKDMYDKNKVYLDKYDYLGLLLSNGETSNFSYELSNGTILLQKNLTDYINNSLFYNNNIIYLDSVIDFGTANISLPNLYVNELLNGDIIISYKDANDNIFINVYGIVPETNELYLIKSNLVPSKASLTFGGSITLVKNEVYYIKYDGVVSSLIKLEPYTGVIELFNLPYSASHSVSIVSNLDGNIVVAGGTNDDTSNFFITHHRVNNKAYLFNTNSLAFTEIGTDILESVSSELFQFHMVYRHDNKITIFNNIDNLNYNGIGDQTTYILDFENGTIVNTMNDHLDKLPYGNTVVLKNGDVIRISSSVKDPQKVYLYAADSISIDDVSDDNSLLYDPTKVIVNNDEYVHIEKPCKYDIIQVKPGGLVSLAEDLDTKYDSTVLIITRDTVMTAAEFASGGYSIVYKACSDAKFIIIG